MYRRAQPEEFDIVILGGGTGATLAAWTFAGEGKRVAIIDRKYIGGSCPNIACLPSKNIIHSAKVASYVRHSDEFGIARDGFKVDMSGVRNRKRKMVSGLNEMYLENYKKTGAELIMGSGRFIAPQNRGGDASGWKAQGAARSQCNYQHRHTRQPAADPRACRGAAADAHRGA